MGSLQAFSRAGRAAGAALVWALLAPGAASGQVLADRDGNGFPDFAEVGDWNGNGVLEMADLQAAMDSLTDPGWKELYVRPGRYLPSAASPNSHALLELPSLTFLRCADPETTILTGLDASVTDVNLKVVSNRDTVSGNTGIVIQNCGIDGGMPASYDSRGWAANGQMGIHLSRVTIGLVAGNRVWRTHHTCLYAKNSQSIHFEDNQLEECGGYGDANSYTRKPAIYLFATQGGVTRDVVVRGNRVIRSGGPALNTRREKGTDRLIALRFEDNDVDNTPAPYAARSPERCFTIRGVDDLRIDGLSCRHSAGILVTSGGDRYYSVPLAKPDANRNVDIRGVVLDELVESRGMIVGSYTEGVKLTDVEVRDTPAAEACISWTTPLRGLVLDGIRVERCGGDGLLQTGPGSGRTKAEQVVLRNVHVSDVDAVNRSDSLHHSGVVLTGRNNGLLLESIFVQKASRHGVQIGSSALGLTNSTLRGIAVDGIEGGFLGRLPAASLPVCNSSLEGSWAIVENAASAASCVASGGPGVANACRCSSGSWGDLANAVTRSGVHIGGGAESRCNSLESVLVSNASGAYGVTLTGAQNNLRVGSVVGFDGATGSVVPQRGALDIDAAASVVGVGNAWCSGTSQACVRGPTVSLQAAELQYEHDCPVSVDPASWNPGPPNTGGSSCGLGFELTFLLPFWAAYRRRPR